MLGRIHSLESFGTVDGPGVRFVVFTQGCPFRCLYCHNPDTWDYNAGTLMSADEILEQYAKNKAFYRDGGITVTGGEPLVQTDFVLELFTKAKAKGIHTCLDTSGGTYAANNPKVVAKVDALLDVTDLVMLDIKHIDNEEHIKLVGIPNKEVLAFARHINAKKKPFLVRHVIVPSITDKPEELYRLGRFLGELEYAKSLDTLPYHQLGVSKYDMLGMEYPLAGVPAFSKEKIPDIRKQVISGMYDYRKGMPAKY